MPSERAADRRQLLSRVELFSKLGERELDDLVTVSRMQKMRARDELFHKGDEGTQIYLILSGRLKVMTTSAEGDDVTFSIAVSGLGPFSYQWKKGGVDVPDATGATLVFENVQSGNAGDYTVEVSNSIGMTTSLAGTLTVQSALTGYALYASGVNWMGMDSSPQGNPDNDPFNNFLEFVFGLDPLVADPTPTVRPRATIINVGGMNYPAVKFRRHRTRAGFQIVVEAVNTLTSQTMQMTTEEAPQDQGGDVDEATYRGQMQIEGLDTWFFRVKVIDTTTP